MKAKHKEICEESEINVVEVVVEIQEAEEIQNFKCEECEFFTDSSEDLDTHITEKHKVKEHCETKEIKLEVFMLVGNENDVLEARKELIEKLSKQNGVEKVDKVFVDKNETFLDIDNLRWNSTDIVLSTSEKVKVWEDNKFRKQIFSNFLFWATYEDECGEYSRNNLKFRKEQTRLAGLRYMVYQV